MTLAAVQKEVEAWSTEEQDQLAAHLATLRLKRTTDHAKELSRRSEDRSPESWLTVGELRKRLEEA